MKWIRKLFAVIKKCWNG